ncbi:glycosyltransferase [Rhodoferax sp. WC2427]|uniref:glycosyltransferase n=1 Tax=Rhodoferax sp. WC2427 TaxID=3234144 RepID=UPI0034662FF1
MNKPTVSVIMPTYNHSKYVKQAIESVLSQTDVDFELIISDDGSTDNTRDVITSISDDRILFFPNTVNRGACIVTNELIGRSRGEFIALINSDDYWNSPDKLIYQVGILRTNPNIGACFGRAQFVDKDGVVITKGSLPFGTVFDQENRSQGLWLRRFFDLSNCICHPTMLIRRSCYIEIGLYNNRFRQLPDFEMWIRLVKRYPIFISDRDLINFRILPGESASSHTSANSIRTINEHLLITDIFFDDVSRDQLIDGFADLLVCKDIPTEDHLLIEKARLLLVENQWLGRPYKIIAMLKIFSCLNNSTRRKIMSETYGMDDRWFQNKMGEIDILKPKIVEDIKEKTQGIRRILKRLLQLVGK